MSTRSAAAKKGWETRRERQEEERRKHDARSAAAKKGWETRRENIRKAQFDTPDQFTEEWIIEEPIDEVGDAYY